MDPEEVSFANPFDPMRCVWFIFCSVHGLKAMRNNLLRSKEDSKATRNFFNGCNFGWEQVHQQCQRDYPTTNKGTVHDTRLSSRVAKPDKFSLMSVKDAIIVFEFKTLIHECKHMATELNCLDATIDTIGSTEG